MSSRSISLPDEGSFGVVTGKTVDVDELQDLDDESLTEAEREVLAADDFIVYGKASIEQYDDDTPAQKIRMSAIEDALPQFFANNGLVSRRHKDTPVGEALREHTLDEPATMEIGGETYSFDAGETLKTEVADDTLWLVANIFSEETSTRGSLLSNQTRLGAYHGELDGFSVTVYTREFTQTEAGQEVTEVDFFAVTIGEDHLIKNEGSEFGVAEFKMFGGQSLRQQATTFMSNRVFNHLFGKSSENLAVETVTVAQEDGLSLNEAAEQVVDDDNDAEAIAAEADEKLQDYEERLDALDEKKMDRSDLATEVADELGLSTEEVMTMFDQLESQTNDGDSESDDDDDSDDDPDSKQSPEGLTEKQRDEVAEVVADTLDDKEFVSQSDIDEKMSDLSEKMEEGLDDVSEDIADNIAEKMETVETPDPDTGGDEDTELDGQMDELVSQFEVNQ